MKNNLQCIIFIIIISSLLINFPIKAQTLISTCDEYIDIGLCDNWSAWYASSAWINMPTAPHNQWPFSPRTLNCPIQVFYKWRECYNNPYIKQIQILSYALNFSYKIWTWRDGWVYPCREALDLLKDSSGNVSLRNNEILDSIVKILVVDSFDQFRSGLPPELPYALCDNPSTNPVEYIAKRGACRGACRVQRPSIPFHLDSIPFEVSTPPVGMLADMYGISSTSLDSIQVAELDSVDLIDLNSYIQTEINSGILENDYKLEPIVIAKDAVIVLTPVDCTSDACCIYKLTLCVDNNGNTQVSEENIGSTPSCSGFPPDTLCPEGSFYSVYPCKSICE